MAFTVATSIAALAKHVLSQRVIARLLYAKAKPDYWQAS